MSYERGNKNCWHSRLHVPANNGSKGKSIHLGSFSSSKEAAIAWNNAVIKKGLVSKKGLNKL